MANAWPWLTEPDLPGVFGFLSAGVQNTLSENTGSGNTGGESTGGRLGDPDAGVLAEYERELATLDRRLSLYRERPDLLALDDDGLVGALVQARELLEAVYRTTIRFPGEDRALQVSPRIGKVAGKLLVLDAGDLTLDPRAPVVISPTIEEVEQGGEAVVARIARINPPGLRRDA